MLSLMSYEYVRSLVSLIIHLVSVSFAVTEYQLSFGVWRLSETNIKNAPAGTKILIFAEKYDMTLLCSVLQLTQTSDYVGVCGLFVVCVLDSVTTLLTD